jgi:hypothetical protein
MDSCDSNTFTKSKIIRNVDNPYWSQIFFQMYEFPEVEQYSIA